MRLYIFDHIKPILLSTTTGITAITELTHKYIFSDTEFLGWLIVAVTVDLVTGILKAWSKEGHKAITSKGVRMTITKFIQYGAFLIITHVLANVKVGEAKYMPFSAIESWAYLLLLLIEIKSVYENLITIDNRLDFVKGIIDKINIMINSKKDQPEDNKPNI